MQNLKPLKLKIYYKLITLIVGSIFLVNCDTNTNSIVSDDVSELMKTESENIYKKQINIDELLIPKETIFSFFLKARFLW